jgi:hypothetical protein
VTSCKYSQQEIIMREQLVNEDDYRGSMLQAWIEAARQMPSQKQRDDFGRLLDWARLHDLPMPLSGDGVADYLLELMVDGASLGDIRRASTSIIACYDEHRCFLDRLPIRAALNLAAAQLAPNRTLN